jgi:hypothetical protein
MYLSNLSQGRKQGMPDGKVLLDLIRKRADQRILFSQHAVAQMSRPERMITPIEIRKVISTGEIIEDYPQDPRGHSCLLLGGGDGDRAIHLVCSPKDDFLAVITAYLPTEEQWRGGFRVRKQP